MIFEYFDGEYVNSFEDQAIQEIKESPAFKEIPVINHFHLLGVMKSISISKALNLPSYFHDICFHKLISRSLRINTKGLIDIVQYNEGEITIEDNECKEFGCIVRSKIKGSIRESVIELKDEDFTKHEKYVIRRAAKIYQLSIPEYIRHLAVKQACKLHFKDVFVPELDLSPIDRLIRNAEASDEIYMGFRNTISQRINQKILGRLKNAERSIAFKFFLLPKPERDQEFKKFRKKHIYNGERSIHACKKFKLPMNKFYDIATYREGENLSIHSFTIDNLLMFLRKIGISIVVKTLRRGYIEIQHGIEQEGKTGAILKKQCEKTDITREDIDILSNDKNMFFEEEKLIMESIKDIINVYYPFYFEERFLKEGYAPTGNDTDAAKQP